MIKQFLSDGVITSTRRLKMLLEHTAKKTLFFSSFFSNLSGPIRSRSNSTNRKQHSVVGWLEHSTPSSRCIVVWAFKG